jgi:dTDP-glucose pyrophosphorylase
MTDLIKNLIENKKKVLTYPVNENDYIDIGQWEEYKSALEHFNKYGTI